MRAVQHLGLTRAFIAHSFGGCLGPLTSASLSDRKEERGLREGQLRLRPRKHHSPGLISPGVGKECVFILVSGGAIRILGFYICYLCSRSEVWDILKSPKLRVNQKEKDQQSNRKMGKGHE